MYLQQRQVGGRLLFGIRKGANVHIQNFDAKTMSQCQKELKGIGYLITPFSYGA